MRPSLPEFALSIADAAATRSEDPKGRVGAVVLGHDGRVLGLGYNGLPPGLDLSPAEWSDRDIVRPLMIHAETNALVGIDPHQAILLATTLGPCHRCVGVAARLGVIEIYSRAPVPAKYAEASLAAMRRFDIKFTVVPLNDINFQLETRRTGGMPVPIGTPGWESRMGNWTMGASGELGELIDEIKKIAYHGKEPDFDHLTKEAGDALWYLVRIIDELGLDVVDVILANNAKLQKRYPDGFVKGGGNR